MMRTPNVYSADEIKNWDVQSCGKNGLWTLARPMSWPGINLQKRIFTGKADVLVWLSEND
jgi:hypothetical protein